MIGIILVFACMGILFLYFFATAGKPAHSWLKEYDYAHRGLHSPEVPENSIPALNAPSGQDMQSNWTYTAQKTAF